MLTKKDLKEHEQEAETEVKAVVEECVKIAWEARWQNEYDAALKE